MPRNLSDRAKEDYALVQQAIQKNDQQAYAKLMNRYRNSIFHMMLKMVHNSDDAEDLTLEAFAKAFKKLESYAPDYAFSTWLFKIASNNCIDYIRKRKLHLVSIDESRNPNDDSGTNNLSNRIKSDTLDPEEKFIRTQKVGLIRDVMKDLSTKYRLMIELRYFEELSYDEIARELDIPLGTVKAQLFRAKEILYNLMQRIDTKQYMDMEKKKKKKKK